MPRFRFVSSLSIVAGLALPLLLGPGVSVPALAGTPADSVVASGKANAPDPAKVLRYAFEVAETSFDPQRISDVYSGIVNNAMFDAPLRYDYLARPAKLIPNTLAALPTVSPDGLTYTFHLRQGIFFDNHEVFGGKKRELVAEDYVYTIKRLFDPKLSAPLLAEVEGYLLGSDEYATMARKANKLDYDAPLAGLHSLDRYTFQIRLTKPMPNFIYNFADCRVACAVAREVVEHYKEDFGAHPVGTGAYRLAFWKRSSKMVFEPNPNYREEYFQGEPAADDPDGQAILKRLQGRRLPMVGRFEVDVIEELQPRWLAFLNQEHELLWRLPEEYATQAVPNNQLAPNLKKRDLRMEQVPALDLTFMYFNIEDPIVGGYTPDKIALRRAVSLGYKTLDEIRIIRKNQAIPAHAPYPPGVAGYDPNFRTSANEYSPAKAKALLDMYGYLDRDGDGYREMPDGSPLVLKFNSTPNARDKQIDELFTRSMNEIGLKLAVRKAKWPDLLKESNAGKLMMWQLGSSAASPDANDWLTSLYGPNAGFKGNRARFKLEAYDRAYEKAQRLPDSPERTALYQEMAKLMVAYAPWKINTHRIHTDMWYPYVIGFRRPLVQTQSWWRFVDIDLQARRDYLAGK
ncbi:MAG: ABC transporter substrate-binding protein [Sterolibacterium sp.]|jgi:ABC-type transport system substrate-binding protein